MLRAAAALLLGTCLALLATPTLCAEGAWMYGLQKNSTTAGPFDIYKYNPLLQEQIWIYSTKFTDANSMEYDPGRNQLFFMVQNPASSNGGYFFNLNTRELLRLGTNA